MENLYKELYDYGTLEIAFEGAFLYLSGEIQDSEEWLMNLHNHLVWRSYEVGQDPNEDCVVLTAINHGLKLDEVEEPELRRIIADLTMN